MNLLVVESDAELAQGIAALLQEENFVVDTVYDGEGAEAVLATQNYDAVLLDLSLPRMSGSDVLARLRWRRNSVPVLMLTEHESIEDKVFCFSAGADDYVVRPFDARELVARVKALIRRRLTSMSTALVCGDLRYCPATREFLLNDEPLGLRRREHGVLETLMLRQGRTVSKAALINSVYTLDEEPNQDVIDVYIHRLRRHLMTSSAEILTLRGMGYMLRTRSQLTI
ncbi:response regulator transcription factor [Paraburkholderia sp. LEh10]|jgi:two-component system response regulator TctD|uniref:response regulator transcription factor n=1 Tax=Paraburkholderia sp. LEh10 TaxID=2821353 RepID=UPI001AE76B70|nr:response regulator transcription factor [Paraburkholderia sp. LEh10]MBP0595555.1 response regulator transcription factor [Paraburkholderia sp. LEh10]